MVSPQVRKHFNRRNSKQFSEERGSSLAGGGESLGGWERHTGETGLLVREAGGRQALNCKEGIKSRAGSINRRGGVWRGSWAHMGGRSVRAWGQETNPRTALHKSDLVRDENPPCSALAKSDREKGTEFSKCKSERKRDTNRSNTASMLRRNKRKLIMTH